MTMFAEMLADQWNRMSSAVVVRASALERFETEVDFARRLAEARCEHREEWERLILQAVSLLADAVAAQGALDIEGVVAEAERILAPLGEAAKCYTIHCVGHAHIDMNWMWNWPETVATAHDTFSTVDRLMAEYPDFKFSQSQASTYALTEQHCPELFERIRDRIAEGRWESTASLWVECESNCAMGETLCRHLLSTRRYMQERFRLTPEDVRITWQPDLFGHPHTLPGILSRGGVRYYYFCRGGRGPRLFWWQGADGSRLLAFDDSVLWYNGTITPDMTRLLFEFESQTGLRDYLFVYGVGDHGGGPTRRDLETALSMNRWPIWPNVRFSTAKEFFDIAERHIRKDLPVVTDELNFVFEGCYTSQSNIKRANRYGEVALPESEALALIARAVTGMPYPADRLRQAWRNTLFNQFHDILPGSGVKATYEYAQGLFQEVMATTGMIKTRALRQIAAKVDTEALGGGRPAGRLGEGVGAGAGHSSAYGTLSTLDGGGEGKRPLVLFNSLPWSRTDVVTATVWDTSWADDRIAVADDMGRRYPAQVLSEGDYWGHRFTTLAFPAEDIPAMGYRTLVASPVVAPVPYGRRATALDSGLMENEFFELQVDPGSGAIVRLLDKRTGRELVPAGERLGMLQVETEAPHDMTAWTIGQIVRRDDLTQGAVLSVTQRGPHMASIRSQHTWGDSQIEMTVTLSAGVPRIDFTLDVNWLERGTPQRGVPMLRAVFPVAAEDPRASYEVPCGHIIRQPNGQEVPALRWADLSGWQDGVGVTLVNDHKYGHNAKGRTMRLTLLRSSYDPDPLPELGRQKIRFGVVPHGRGWTVADATRSGASFNQPLIVVATDSHAGTLPTSQSFAEVLTPGVMLSGLKKAEDSDAVIVRVYEMLGQVTEARIRLSPEFVPSGSTAIETDLMERPLGTSFTRMEGDELVVNVPAYGIATVRVG